MSYEIYHEGEEATLMGWEMLSLFAKKHPESDQDKNEGCPFF
jgi:hypothetical protein